MVSGSSGGEERLRASATAARTSQCFPLPWVVFHIHMEPHDGGVCLGRVWGNPRKPSNLLTCLSLWGFLPGRKQGELAKFPGCTM